MENYNYTLQENIQTLVNGDSGTINQQELMDKVSAQPEGAEELLFSNSLALALHHPEKVAAAAIIRTVIQEEGFPPPPSAPAIRPWLIFSLAFFSMLSVALFFSWNAITKKQNVHSKEIEPLENVFFLAGTGQSIGDLQLGMAAYDAGNYVEAERYLQLYVATNPDYAAKLYLGVTRLLSGKIKKAIVPLQDATQSPESPVKEAAQWYLALAYLNNGEVESARNLLRDLSGKSIYADKAEQLLEKIK